MQNHIIPIIEANYIYNPMLRNQSNLLLFSSLFLSGNSFFWPIMLNARFCSKFQYLLKVKLPYSRKFSEGEIFGNFGKKPMISENIFPNILCSYIWRLEMLHGFQKFISEVFMNGKFPKILLSENFPLYSI